MWKNYRWGLAIALVASFATNIISTEAIANGIPARWAAKRYKVPSLGSPVRREAAATRGNCVTDLPIALTPLEGIAVTTTAYPTFYLRVPAIPTNSPVPLEFTLKDGNKTVYQAKFQLAGKRRIIALSLPATGILPPLEIDRDYRWSSSIQCSNDSEEAVNLVTNSIIRRVAPDAALTAKLEAVSASSSTATKPEIYAEAEIWQDALTELVNLRRLQPTNPQVAAQWQTLLKSADLGTVVNDPLP
ncbi:DUF928 domain-containing protein [Chamaesiphon minutus]|uniref:DUF928 domain-containing protein n=1 Tax=Chamaesiphon minutus (strain ATCC 27169 / PCC 6605) TaxID=1173020 RepID=K9UQQ1_CHAP6|nr:DUF928 domain-containing protein [Chamaesiphon minutus]AFY96574.1 protein of unknown function (DUF928) [Chamaesiphon minutus PCC 6605]